MRSEGNQLFEALDELIRISRAAEIPAEIYHLKAAGKENWGESSTSCWRGSKPHKRKG